MIKAIETQYKGYRFRSRLEARYAVMFDAMGIRWEYEPQGFECEARLSMSEGRTSTWDDGAKTHIPPMNPIRYLPDFYLPDLKMWVEVKGSVDGFKVLDFLDVTADILGGCDYAYSARADGMLVLGPLSNGPRTPLALHFHKGDLLMYTYAPLRVAQCGGEWTVAGDYGGTWEDITADSDVSETETELAFGQLLLAGVPQGGEAWEPWWNVAKRARFEHGESGATGDRHPRRS